MKQRKSEVFDNFAEIALKDGLISKNAEEKTNPRYDSYDISAIEALYGVKPNGKDEKDILDQAHPEPVIIAPSYDRVNGLIENLKERHNIMMGIVMKPHQAKLTQHRYAKQELFDELIRLGFKLDNQDELALSKLADSCAERLTKEAVLPLAVPVIAGVGAVLGVIALISHFAGMIDQGVVKNCDRAVTELTDVINEGANVSLSPVIENMIKNISYIKSLGVQALQVKVPAPSVDAAITLKDSPEIHAGKILLDNYATACETLAEYIPSYIGLLKNAPNSDASGDPGWWAATKKMVHFVWPEEIEDAVTALETLQSSLNSSRSKITEYEESIKAYVDQNKEDIQKKIQDRIHADVKPKAVAPGPGLIEDQIKAKKQVV